jgi:hypothetical protein
MSIHPQGLSEDPFAPPATLSLEEASHLIQRRVFACGGDGAALFPLATCAEIHRQAQGRPDAIWGLAGRAMRAAAAEGALAVSSAHVRLALGTTVEAEEAAASDLAAETAAVPLPSLSADDDDIPDLPAGVPGGFELPRAPSESLADDARDWVSRFLPSPGAGPAAGAAARIAPAPPILDETPGGRAAPPIHDETPVGRAAPPGDEAGRTPAPPPPARRRRSRRRGRPSIGGIAAAAAAGAVIIGLAAVGLRQLPRGRTHPTEPVPRTIVPAAGPAIDPGTARPDVAAGAHPRSPVAPRPGPAAKAATGATVAPSDSSRRAAPALRLGLEVATFIFEDRAEAERDRLVVAGYPARLVTTSENGAPSYRVVLGPFPSQVAAERVADQLLAAGTVQQARVVTLGLEK